MMKLRSYIIVLWFMITAIYSQNSQLFPLNQNTGNWFSVTDSLIGGKSAARVQIANNQLLFSGRISQEQGFASIRSPQILGEMNSFAGIQIRFRGDGDYFMNVYTSLDLPSIAYGCKFTAKSQWREIFIPFQKFEYMYLPFRKEPTALDIRKIQRIGFMKVSEKRNFRLQIGWIKFIAKKAISKEQDDAIAWLKENNAKKFADLLEGSHFHKFLLGKKSCTVFVIHDKAFQMINPGYKRTLAENVVAKNFFLAAHIMIKAIRKPRIEYSPFKSIIQTSTYQDKIFHFVDISSPTYFDDYLTQFSLKEFIKYILSLGVPLYNIKDENLCRDVYYVALQFIEHRHKSKLPVLLQQKIHSAIKQDLNPPIQRAWEYRALLDEAEKYSH